MQAILNISYFNQKREKLLLIGNHNGSGSTELLGSSGGFESLPSLLELLRDLSIRKTLIGELILEHHKLELNLALAIMLEDVLVGLLHDAAHALVVVKASGRIGDLSGPRFDEELVSLYVTIGPRPPWSL